MKDQVFHISFVAILLLSCSGIYAQSDTALYNQGLTLKNQKKTEDAIKKFKEALLLRPGYTEALYEIGWCQNDLKDYSGALITLRKVRIAWPLIPKVHFELGYAFEQTNATDSAIKSYKKCLELKPDYSLAYKRLGYISYEKGDYKETLEYFKKYENSTKLSITDYLYWYRKGFTHNALKEYSEAILALKNSLLYKKDYINTYLELGYANSRLKIDGEAISYFKQAIDVDPKSHIAYNGIAEVYRDNKKDMNEAMTWYRKTLAINPTERKACYGMGYCLNNQAKYNEAIPFLKTAIEKEPTYAAAYVELGYSYFKTGAESDAIEKLNKAISLSPLNENARYYLGLIYIKQGNKTKARQMLDELKKLSSKNAELLEPKVNAM